MNLDFCYNYGIILGSCSFGFGFCPVLNGLGTDVFGANVIASGRSEKTQLK
jgi:hypothetical protein